MGDDETAPSLRIEQPFKCEYAKSGRAACKSCKNKIDKDELRLAKMVKIPAFDGVSPHWYHFDCFFEKNRPKSTGDMGHFSSLRFEDQKRIEEKISKSSAAAASMSDFGVEYAKSGKSSCVLCEVKIPINDLRISKTDEESDAAVRLGRPLPRYFHVDCFVSTRQELGFFESGEKLPNFDGLEPADKQMIKKKIPKMGTKRKAAPETNGKSKVEPKKTKADKELEKTLKEQSDLLYSYIDKSKLLKSTEIDCILQYNNCEPPRDKTRKVEALADAMAFGALERCPECKDGQLNFRIAGYICSGMVSDCVRCVYETKTPKRKPFKVPTEYKEAYEFLAEYKFKPRTRVMPKVQGPVDAVDIADRDHSGNGFTPSVTESNDQPDPSKPLKGHKICTIGKLARSARDIKKAITDLGGSIVPAFDRTVLFGITTAKEIEKESDKINQAQTNNVILVKEDVIQAITSADREDVPSLIVKNALCEWGAQDVEKKFVNLVNKSKVKSSKSGSSKSKSSNFPDKVKLIIKDGTAVDPQSELEGTAIVHREGARIYSEVLNKVDLQANKNSFYKLQLLKDEKAGRRFWVFKSWGRIGTDIGNCKTESFRSLEDARQAFEDAFFDKTGNPYSARGHMKRKANFYYPIEVSYAGDEIKTKGLKLELGKSDLPEAVQKLILMMFDVQLMENEMKEFELDMTKMPLGKISKKQLLSAYNILTEISKLIDGEDSKKTKAKLVSQCEAFYTLVPHTFETPLPPLIKTKEMVEKKREMLDSLLEMEIACDLMNSVKEEQVTDDPIKQHYLKLNTDLSVLSPKETEFKVINEYLTNTHAKTHTVKLKIMEAFKVRRFGEEERYAKHASLNNKMLLWHGSRITNFASILSQGLRIAPPEAPVTGYMFGKGIYFADMSTKSANYCYPQANSNVGLLALCEVALGEMHELTQAEFVTELPFGKHSVKGVGKTAPDPKKNKTIDGDVVVPCGPGMPTGVKDTSLLYNEFIVYDVSQLKIRYLLMVQFEDSIF